MFFEDIIIATIHHKQLVKNIPQSVGPNGAAMMRVSRKQAECLIVGDIGYTSC
jgi:hypothetical protein